MSVSYTHLDVYKRQLLPRAEVDGQLMPRCVASCWFRIREIHPVFTAGPIPNVRRRNGELSRNAQLMATDVVIAIGSVSSPWLVREPRGP